MTTQPTPTATANLTPQQRKEVSRLERECEEIGKKILKDVNRFHEITGGRFA